MLKINTIIKKIIFSTVLLSLLGLAFAAQPTPAGTTINTETLRLLHNGEQLVTADLKVTLTVGAIYGLETIPTSTRTTTLNSLEPVYFNHTVINKANTIDAVVLNTSYLNSNWTYQLIADTNGDGVHQSGENTVLTSPVNIAAQSTLNIFLKMNPVNYVAINTGLLVSTNHLAHSYTGFNLRAYSGAGKIKVSDNIAITSTPSITAVAPTPGAQNVPPNLTLLIDTDCEGVSVSWTWVDILINNEWAVISGNFTSDYLGSGSRFIPSANGYRICVDKVGILPMNTTCSVTVNVRSIYGSQAQTAYQFRTGTISFISFKLQSLLQGYYIPQNDQMVPAVVKVEFRTARNTAASTSFNISLNSHGDSNLIQLPDVPAGDYYVYIKHFNHVKVVTAEKITFTSAAATINISHPASPNFRAIYLSSLAQNVTQAMRTETNGKLTVRGGDYNNDNTINIVDWSAFDYEWKNSGVIADFDGNGMIDTRDYGIWLSNNQDYLPLD